MNRLILVLTLGFAIVGTASANGLFHSTGPAANGRNVVAGMVNSDGTVLRGKGFNVRHLGNGQYRIAFTKNQFTGQCPIMVVTDVGSTYYAPVATVSQTYCGNVFDVYLWHAGENVTQDFPFAFLARDTD